jgi:hypothetical protein
MKNPITGTGTPVLINIIRELALNSRETEVLVEHQYIVQYK